MIHWLVIGLGVAGVLWTVDRLLLLCEERGWIYYRRKRGSSGTLSSAFLSAQSLLEPGARHVVEQQKRTEAEEEDEDGDPPEGGTRAELP